MSSGEELLQNQLSDVIEESEESESNRDSNETENSSDGKSWL